MPVKEGSTYVLPSLLILKIEKFLLLVIKIVVKSGYLLIGQ